MLRYLFRQKRVILTVLLCAVLFVAIGLAFANTINQALQGLDTWRNTESSYIAYDSVEFDSNCYVYYGKDVYFGLGKDSLTVINADVYQFIEGKTYDSKSLFNEKNVAEGQYSPLKGNEIALPLAVAKKHGLKLGDSVYLFRNEEYTVKYIFNDVYEIKNVGIYSSGNVVLVGASEYLYHKYQYAVFDNVSRQYDEVYLFSETSKEFTLSIMLFIAVDMLLVAAVSTVNVVIFAKSKQKTLYKLHVAGNVKGYYQALFGVGALLLICPAVLASAVMLIVGSIAVSVVICAVALVIYLAEILYLRMKIR